jgi:hypothetical protein
MSEAVVGMKRKRDDNDDNDDGSNPKRLCKGAAPGPSDSTTTSHPVPHTSKEGQKSAVNTSETGLAADPAEPAKMLPDAEKKDTGRKEKQKPRNKPIVIPFKPKPKIIKLTPNRPYPSVPTSSSATGPRSKRKEGNNKICVTRRTELGAYLKRCKDVFVKQGLVDRPVVLERLHLPFWHRYKELYLTAMGAAIPHVVMLATSLPGILPYDRREIKTTVTTGTVSVTDEVIPQDSDDEGGTRTRMKASVEIVIRVVPGEGMEVDNNTDTAEGYDSFSD